METSFQLEQALRNTGDEDLSVAQLVCATENESRFQNINLHNARMLVNAAHNIML